MTISEIYQTYNIPTHLQIHMLRVAAVGQHLINHWKTQVHTQDIISTLLLHDMGNLLKFDLTTGMHFFDKSEQDLSHWKSVQEKMKKQYGEDEHDATFNIAQEIGVGERVLWLLEHIGSSNLHRVIDSHDNELKICAYSDFRVDPHGFTTVEKRFYDIIARYEGRKHTLADKKRTLEKMEYCLELEKIIQNKVNADLKRLPIDELNKQIKTLKKFNTK